jgi:SecD/SecF fusion protein
MTENLGKKITLTAILAVVFILCLVLPERPFRLGLDLAGGTRRVYQFDFQEAVNSGKISREEAADPQRLLQEFCNTLRDRVDPNGVMELSLVPEGNDRVVIEVPGVAEIATARVSGKLAAAIDASATSLTLTGISNEDLKTFPRASASIRIGDEQIAYAAREGTQFNGLTRGDLGTTAAPHAVGATVELLTTDEIEKRIENVGDMQFLLGARPDDITRLGSDLQKEQEKAGAWAKANPGRRLDDFNALPLDKGGPVAGLLWFPNRIGRDEAETPIETRLVPLVRPANALWNFSGDDIEAVGFSSDNMGAPAVSFEIAAAKKAAFGDFTQANIGQGMAIVLNGEVATLATIKSKLPGSGIIEGGRGGFTQKEVKDLVDTLRAGSLRIRPTLLERSRVGATLGDAYVKAGFYSSIVALLVVAVFMIAIYRRLGVLAVISLAINLLFLLGAMAFLRATLTLPGIAGIVLTLGMAVDGNILIYERLREELARGLKLAQAAKASFERAAVAIIDSNLTTLIAGAILYYVGTGPIRGFATTLNIGILSTLFTVIVVTNILVFSDLKRGVKSYTMGKILVNPGWDFLKWTKPATALSLVLCLGGLGLFATMPKSEKLGIDFTGGFTLRVNTEDPQSEAKIRELLSTVPGAIGRSAQVRPVQESGNAGTGYRSFRIAYKLEDSAQAAVLSGESRDSSQSGEESIRKALATVLQSAAVTAKIDAGQASGLIHLESAHPADDIRTTLAEAGLSEPKVEASAGKTGVYSFSGATTQTSAEALVNAVQGRIQSKKDSTGKLFVLSTPVPESNFIGSSIGEELANAAVLAVLLSLLGTILYLRVRFAEYSYGIAVVVSLAHDVIIALGALAVGTKLGFVQAEVDLSMIAAFLTIIGYSQNDTIVIFDRVRENRTKSDKPLSTILNDSLNETLGRTILTSATVLVTLLVLFGFNYGSRNVLEGISYCLIVGVISGSYSTIYIAGPVLLWADKRAAAKAAAQPSMASSTAKTGA